MPASKCQCGCGQAPAATTRLRKASCPCGQSIIRLSRSALSIVSATCMSCDADISPDCLFDRTCSHDEHDAQAAVYELERQCGEHAERSANYQRRALRQMRCPGRDGRKCGQFVPFGANCDPTADPIPCPKCGSVAPATFGAPRKPKAKPEAMPF